MFRTLMATYRPGMGPRILHFSNPVVLEDGEPTGIDSSQPDSANCARAINETRHLVAGYR